MKVYIEPAEDQDRAVTRVRKALVRYAPGYVEFVLGRYDANLVIMNVNGRLKRTTRRIKEMERKGIKYAVIQYCLKSTMNKVIDEWVDVWDGANLVWSYLDLPESLIPNFYHAPLGVDSRVFHPHDVDKEYLVLVSSKNYLSESTREVFKAAEAVGGKVAYLGWDLGREGVDYYTEITDGELAELYSKCRYVTGLRRTEGFELPAAEGLLCGARPIVFDRTHYLDWYKDFAVTIPETHRDQIVDDLIRAFKLPYRYVTISEIRRAQKIFNWKDIVEDFWRWL